MEGRFESNYQWDCFFSYGPVTSLSLQTASVALEYHGKNNRGPNQQLKIKMRMR